MGTCLSVAESVHRQLAALSARLPHPFQSEAHREELMIPFRILYVPPPSNKRLVMKAVRIFAWKRSWSPSAALACPLYLCV